MERILKRKPDLKTAEKQQCTRCEKDATHFVQMGVMNWVLCCRCLDLEMKAGLGQASHLIKMFGMGS